MVSIFLSGLFLGSGPCWVTCGPILVSYIAGTKQNLRQSILFWLLFSLGRICVYLILSVSIFILGEFLVRQNLAYIAKYVYAFGGMIIILIGILIIRDSIKTTQACLSSSRLAKFLQNTKGCGFTLGLVMGLLPCMPLLAIVSYIGLLSFSWQRCILYSLIFGLGTLISPLILLALGAGFVPRLLFNKPKLYRTVRLICGFIIIFFGAQLIF